MTRCYKFYCIIERDGRTACGEKKDRNIMYIFKYVRMMKARGVLFDFSKEDEKRFEETRKELGSEGTATRQEKCTIVHHHKKRSTWKNSVACPHCNEIIIVNKRGDRYVLEKKPKKDEPVYETIDSSEGEMNATKVIEQNFLNE